MNTLIIVIGLVIIIAVISYNLSSGRRERRKVHQNNRYAYRAKALPMTRTEAEFFAKLNDAVEERYFVFPQLHLSSILRPNEDGERNSYAFRHINGKSVDYVLCDNQTLKPRYAIELDDATHERRDRRIRDAEVERIFDEADIPLVRIRDKDIGQDEIIRLLTDAARSRR